MGNCPYCLGTGKKINSQLTNKPLSVDWKKGTKEHAHDAELSEVKADSPKSGEQSKDDQESKNIPSSKFKKDILGLPKSLATQNQCEYCNGTGNYPPGKDGDGKGGAASMGMMQATMSPKNWLSPPSNSKEEPRFNFNSSFRDNKEQRRRSDSKDCDDHCFNEIKKPPSNDDGSGGAAKVLPPKFINSASPPVTQEPSVATTLQTYNKPKLEPSPSLSQVTFNSNSSMRNDNSWGSSCASTFNVNLNMPTLKIK